MLSEFNEIKSQLSAAMNVSLISRLNERRNIRTTRLFKYLKVGYQYNECNDEQAILPYKTALKRAMVSRDSVHIIPEGGTCDGRCGLRRRSQRRWEF